MFQLIIGALNGIIASLPFFVNYCRPTDHPTNQQTDMRIHREVVYVNFGLGTMLIVDICGHYV